MADDEPLPPQSMRPPDKDATLGYVSYVLVVLMVCYTLSFADRQILALLVGPIWQDLGIGETGGLLHGLAFAVLYTLQAVVSGTTVRSYRAHSVAMDTVAP